jgi:hypothetical protein
MPDLFESLQGRDLGHLKIIASLWGIPLNAPDTRVGLLRLCPQMLDVKHVEATIKELPEEVKKALEELYRNDGRISWAFFIRSYGELRELGVGKRDRERPYANNPSITEYLWYRGLIARNFFELPGGPEEYAYIPDDLFLLLPRIREDEIIQRGRPASQGEKAFLMPANDHILDLACTLLVALRIGIPESEIPNLWEGLPEPVVLLQLLKTSGLIGEDNIPLLEPTRKFLEERRGEALSHLVRSWIKSIDFNELRLLPGIIAEGEWQNDPLLTRQVILGFLPKPSGEVVVSNGKNQDPYWSLGSFINAIKQNEPDFQRPAGDYQSWYLRDLTSGEYLNGFECWDQVDGALIRFILSGPLYWLGILDLAAPGEGMPASAFRYSDWARNLLKGEPPTGLSLEDKQVIPRSDANIWVPRYAPRSVRYQIARFCEWGDEKDDGFIYQITPASLQRALKAGLKVSQLSNLLRKYANTVPPAISRALIRWEEKGTEVYFRDAIVLRVNSTELLQELRNSRVARFLSEPLGPTTIIVKKNSWLKVQAFLAEMGYLSSIAIEEDSKKNPLE